MLSKIDGAIEDIYASFQLDDILQIDDNNAKLCKQTVENIKKLPREMRMDYALKAELKNEISKREAKKELRASQRTSFIITNEKQNSNNVLQEQFEKCIGAYLLLGGKDIYGKFHDVIHMMNTKGVRANAGLAVIHYGERIVANMEELNENSGRNGQAWKLLLEPVLHAYTLSKEIGNERYNSKEQQEFEERLVNLRIIERERDNQSIVPVKSNLKERIMNRLHSRNDKNNKDKMKQPVLLEQTQLRQVISEYINTGSVPLGFKLDEMTGQLMKESEMDKMRKEAQIRANQQKQIQRDKVKARQGQRMMIGIQQQVSNKAYIPLKPKLQNRQQPKREQQLYNR